jgi:hypothetical protein
MNIRTLITGMALTGALLASASVAKANAYMELISGSTTVQIEPGGAIHHSGPYTDQFSSQVGDGALFIGVIGSWGVDIASGGESGGFNVTLTDNINGNITQTHGLEVIFSSGGYALSGGYNFGGSDAGGNSLATTIGGFYSSSLYTGSGSLGTSMEPSTFVSATDPKGPWILPKTLAASYQNTDIQISGTKYITETMLFGGTTGTIPSQKVTMNATASFTPYRPVVVPDGGTTATMVGSALLGLVGLRSKFGAKRF